MGILPLIFSSYILCPVHRLPKISGRLQIATCISPFFSNLYSHFCEFSVHELCFLKNMFWAARTLFQSLWYFKLQWYLITHFCTVVTVYVIHNVVKYSFVYFSHVTPQIIYLLKRYHRASTSLWTLGFQKMRSRPLFQPPNLEGNHFDWGFSLVDKFKF